jgi:hypothetical protein
MNTGVANAPCYGTRVGGALLSGVGPTQVGLLTGAGKSSRVGALAGAESSI